MSSNGSSYTIIVQLARRVITSAVVHTRLIATLTGQTALLTTTSRPCTDSLRGSCSREATSRYLCRRDFLPHRLSNCCVCSYSNLRGGKECSATMDVGTEYLNADMEKMVHMRIDLAFAKLKWRTWTSKEGWVIVQLLKALYGYLESAKLWYRNLEWTLRGLTFLSLTQKTPACPTDFK
jgi:hypothetical protein